MTGQQFSSSCQFDHGTFCEFGDEHKLKGDSNPDVDYRETAKAGRFVAVLIRGSRREEALTEVATAGIDI